MRKRIGDIFVEKGILSEEQLSQVAEYAQKHGMRLGDAGVKLGLIKPQVLIDIFGHSNREDFFYLDVNYFPQVTQKLFDTATLLRYGVLPLGFKSDNTLFHTKKVLNLGMLQPEKKDEILPEIEKLATERLGENAFQDIKVYLILAEQFLNVLEQKYNIPESEIRQTDQELAEELIIYLDSGSKVLSTRFMDMPEEEE